MDIVDHRVPAGYAPPPHVHSDQDEVFYIISGQFDVRCGEQRWEAGPGDLVFLPRRVPHSFVVSGDEPGRTLLINAPAGFAEVIVELGQATTELKIPGDESLPPTKSASLPYPRRRHPPGIAGGHRDNRGTHERTHSGANAGCRPTVALLIGVLVGAEIAPVEQGVRAVDRSGSMVAWARRCRRRARMRHRPPTHCPRPSTTTSSWLPRPTAPTSPGTIRESTSGCRASTRAVIGAAWLLPSGPVGDKHHQTITTINTNPPLEPHSPNIPPPTPSYGRE